MQMLKLHKNVHITLYPKLSNFTLTIYCQTIVLSLLTVGSLVDHRAYKPYTLVGPPVLWPVLAPSSLPWQPTIYPNSVYLFQISWSKMSIKAGWISWVECLHFKGSSQIDTFKFSDLDDWKTAWTSRIEPHLKDYEVMRDDKLALVKTETKTALYDNFFSARLVFIFICLNSELSY